MYIKQPEFPLALRRFLHFQVHPDSDILPDLVNCPAFEGKISVFHSAVARFYAPSDLCGAGGMYQERIRAAPSWYGRPRHDTAFVVLDESKPGMLGMVIARVLLFFSFHFCNKNFPCSLVNWFVPGDQPGPGTSMWVVQPELDHRKRRAVEVIHIDSIARGAHLLPVYGTAYLPEDLEYTDALDVFKSFFVNKFTDHHTHEFLSQ